MYRSALFLVSTFLFVSFAQAQWQSVAQGIPNYCQIYSMAVDGTTIYIGGIIPNFNNLVKYDTLTGNLSMVSNGSKATVLTLLLRGDELFVGATGNIVGSGSFVSRVNLTLNQWAVLNVTNAPNSNVLSLANYNGELIVGLGGNPYVYRYASNSYWATMNPSPSINDFVRALSVIDSGLYAAGDFVSPCSRFAKWNGTNWACVSTNTLSHFAYSIGGNSASSIYVGGSFSGGLVVLNGSEFQNVTNWNFTSGFTGSQVLSLLQINDQLFLGGYKLPQTSAGILSHNGSGLFNVSSGISGTFTVYSIVSAGGNLYAGGNGNYLQRLSFTASPTPQTSPTPVPTPKPTPKPTPAPTPQSTDTTTTTSAPSTSTTTAPTEPITNQTNDSMKQACLSFALFFFAILFVLNC